MNDSEIRDSLRARKEEIMRVAAEYGISDVQIIRSPFQSRSEYDFLVTFEPDRSLFDLGGFLSALQALLARKVFVISRAGLKSPLREWILSEAELL